MEQNEKNQPTTDKVNIEKEEQAASQKEQNGGQPTDNRGKAEGNTAASINLDELEQTVGNDQQSGCKNSARTDELYRQLEQEKEKYVRLAAEFDNFRKRSAREREALFADAFAEAVGVFLPLYDNVERALANPCADQAYKKGVELIMKQINDIFTKLEITETPGVGQPFDPAYHNAVMHIQSDDLPENTVAEVLQKGFIMKARVLRYAMVKAAN